MGDNTRYYFTGGTWVAMQKGNDNLLWLLGDPFGSTSKAVNYDVLTEHFTAYCVPTRHTKSTTKTNQTKNVTQTWGDLSNYSFLQISSDPIGCWQEGHASSRGLTFSVTYWEKNKMLDFAIKLNPTYN